MIFFNDDKIYRNDRKQTLPSKDSSMNIIDSAMTLDKEFQTKDSASLLLKNDFHFLDSSSLVPMTFTSIFNFKSFQVIKNHFKSIFKINYSDDFFQDVYQGKYYSIIGMNKETKEIICFSHIDIDKKTKSAKILTIGVVKEYQGKKIGTRLLNKVIEELNVLGVLEISLIVQEVNTIAVKLYTNYGFKVDKEMEEYYSLGSSINNKALLMVLRVNIKPVWVVEVFKKVSSFIF